MFFCVSAISKALHVCGYKIVFQNMKYIKIFLYLHILYFHTSFFTVMRVF